MQELCYLLLIGYGLWWAYMMTTQPEATLKMQKAQDDRLARFGGAAVKGGSFLFRLWMTRRR